MNILFLSRTYNWDDEKKLLQISRAGLPGGENAFQWALIEGIEENLGKYISKINEIPLGAFPNKSKKILIRKNINNEKSFDIGFLNIPLIKRSIQEYSIYNNMKKWYKISEDNRKVIIYGACLHTLKACYKIKKEYDDIEFTLIVTDLPEYYPNNSFIIQKLLKVYNKKIYKYIYSMDKYILLTKYMNEKVNVNKKPYLVIEGICNTRFDDKYESNSKNNNKKIILYTGSLDNKYGIIKLIEAFLKINRKEYELWICGEGVEKNKIKEYCSKNNNIKYLGYLSKKEILNLQKKSSILINPRENKGDYVKYSFPSKIMDYMLSGKPILCYKLYGIPDEYDKYLNYINDNSIEGIRKSIIENCEDKYEENMIRAIKGKEFIIAEKSKIVQGKKIINFIMEKN